MLDFYKQVRMYAFVCTCTCVCVCVCACVIFLVGCVIHMAVPDGDLHGRNRCRIKFYDHDLLTHIYLTFDLDLSNFMVTYHTNYFIYDDNVAISDQCLECFAPLIETELATLISSANSSTCILDPIPTCLFKQICPGVIKSLLNVVNSSLTTGYSALRKYSAPLNFSTFCHISGFKHKDIKFNFFAKNHQQVGHNCEVE
ncbi:hypothetical protein AMELA_G00085790 [Ameiurus melas]|uniref:Uncharacterized protein n=1 Tax=Ameiurus melas TaxID=219545 RepID=A0A7J6AUP6_AMEME|nr:hypothetical protein AMELA_G00085790 [Ameiurus melas]